VCLATPATVSKLEDLRRRSPASYTVPPAWYGHFPADRLKLSCH